MEENNTSPRQIDHLYADIQRCSEDVSDCIKGLMFPDLDKELSPGSFRKQEERLRQVLDTLEHTTIELDKELDDWANTLVGSSDSRRIKRRQDILCRTAINIKFARQLCTREVTQLHTRSWAESNTPRRQTDSQNGRKREMVLNKSTPAVFSGSRKVADDSADAPERAAEVHRAQRGESGLAGHTTPSSGLAATVTSSSTSFTLGTLSLGSDLSDSPKVSSDTSLVSIDSMGDGSAPPECQLPTSSHFSRTEQAGQCPVWDVAREGRGEPGPVPLPRQSPSATRRRIAAQTALAMKEGQKD